MTKQSTSNPVDYARRVYESTIDWYNNADTKAEIILTLDGAFLAFVTGSLFINQTNLREIIQKFSWITWLFLLLMSLCLVGSIVTAILCLWSRISLTDNRSEQHLAKYKIQANDLDTYAPEATYFFQEISWLNAKLYQRYLQSVDDNFELAALTANIYILSGHVLQKHRHVDWSFVLAGGNLISFFAMGISYILTI